VIGHPIGTPGIRVHIGLLIAWEAAFEMLFVETIAVFFAKDDDQGDLP
jgi:hypothetical protein